MDVGGKCLVVLVSLTLPPLYPYSSVLEDCKMRVECGIPRLMSRKHDEATTKYPPSPYSK